MKFNVFKEEPCHVAGWKRLNPDDNPCCVCDPVIQMLCTFTLQYFNLTPMQITTLVENLVYQPGLVAEHGLSFYIDTGKRRILFDTGQRNAFLVNARVMGIDLGKADALVISHGHYDHTGGLNAFLKANTTAPVYLKKQVLNKKYNANRQFIGTPSIPDSELHRFKFIDEMTKIDEGVFIVPDIPVVNKTDTSFSYFYTHDSGNYTEDKFEDELFLALVNPGNVSVISSCSHRGITNIVEAAKNRFNLPVKLITGGFHLKGVPEEQIRFVTDYLKQAEPESVGICHCTGVDKLPLLTAALGEKVFYNHTGNRIQV